MPEQPQTALKRAKLSESANPDDTCASLSPRDAGTVVDFAGPDDPYHPLNWPFTKKSLTTILYGLTTFSSTYASAAYSPANATVSALFHVDQQTALLGTSLLLLGFGFGPLVWAPVSEYYGRKWAVLVPCFLAMLGSLGTAQAQNLQTLLITRFLTGFFGSSPITCTGGVFADIWHPTQRGTAIVAYALAVAGGPVFAPIVGGAIVAYGVNWRWTEYLTAIIQGSIFVLDVLLIDESYPSILLVYKARALRRTTGNPTMRAEFEGRAVSFRDILTKFGLRPIQMLCTPICFLVALYASFIYGVFYACLASFPIIFGEGRGMNQFVGSLPFLALLVGISLGSAVNVWNQIYYRKRYVTNGNVAVPEARLPPMMLGSFIFAGGLFTIGWTASPHIHWIFPCLGAVMMGLGYYTIFQSALNYLIDVFERWGASAIAANTFLRSTLAAAFPLIVPPLYHRIGIGWATSVFGGVAVCLIPIPFFFWSYGPSIRKRGKYTAKM
ncbi:major facilitator superfamily domain-containing protein [Fimicolochytrium jonesii]|uniref:major facilitator superfamily domain-containing protein n=1 Tax=Fimicolochytrium jonesii TaxID=1396493 RepID=UPI0022FE7974|nr:major facilitator superfamily domain-containing protein [Fimicolochytrium jonesii]KAI8826001.1 major facilitator superfamily domain-containing protein [Fimicolochytrium jonesii]